MTLPTFPTLAGQTFATKSPITATNVVEHVLLDIDMPRNIFAPTCLHTLFDLGCGLPAGAFSTNGVVGASSTTSLVNFSGALAAHLQGKIVFSSGANAGMVATVKYVVAGTSLTLMYPLPEPPAAGDAITVYQGCDHTMGTCGTKFDNLANFRAFAFVPPPQMAM